MCNLCKTRRRHSTPIAQISDTRHNITGHERTGARRAKRGELRGREERGEGIETVERESGSRAWDRSVKGRGKGPLTVKGGREKKASVKNLGCKFKHCLFK